MAFGLRLGVALGTIAVLVGAGTGAIASFLLGRYLLRHQVVMLSKRFAIFEALNAALKQNGFKIFFLIRLSPIVPFNVINYIGGVTSISLRNFVLALFGIIPGTIIYVFLGASAGSLAESGRSGSDPVVTIIIAVVGTILGVIAIWLTTRYARQELKNVLELRQCEVPESSDSSMNSTGLVDMLDEESSGNLSTDDENNATEPTSY